MRLTMLRGRLAAGVLAAAAATAVPMAEAVQPSVRILASFPADVLKDPLCTTLPDEATAARSLGATLASQLLSDHPDARVFGIREVADLLGARTGVADLLRATHVLELSVEVKGDLVRYGVDLSALQSRAPGPPPMVEASFGEAPGAIVAAVRDRLESASGHRIAIDDAAAKRVTDWLARVGVRARLSLEQARTGQYLTTRLGARCGGPDAPALGLAQERLEALVSTDPDDDEAALQLANVEIRRAMNVYPTNRDLASDLAAEAGRILDRVGASPTKGIAESARFLLLRASHSVVTTGRYDQAVTFASRAAAADETSAEAQFYLGFYQLRRSETYAEEALAHLSRAIELEPTLLNAGAYRIRAYHLLGKEPEREREYNRVLAIREHPGTLYQRAAMAYRDKDYDKALAILDALERTREFHYIDIGQLRALIWSRDPSRLPDAAAAIARTLTPSDENAVRLFVDATGKIGRSQFSLGNVLPPAAEDALRSVEAETEKGIARRGVATPSDIALLGLSAGLRRELPAAAAFARHLQEDEEAIRKDNVRTALALINRLVGRDESSMFLEQQVKQRY